MRPLRPRQQVAITLLRNSLGRGNKRVMLAAPTGFGKTLTAAHIIQSALDKGNRVIFCVNAISLVEQAVQDFWNEGIKNIGVMQGQHEMTNRAMPVQVCSIQTLQNRSIPDADLVIIDEAHNWFKFYGEWMAQWDAVPFIGLSATPWTKGLGKYYQDLIIPATTADLIDEKFLSPFRVYAPAHPDLTGVKMSMGDYNTKQLGSAMDKSPLIADIASTWLKHGEGRPTICYGVNRAHAKHIQREFEARGVKCGYIDAYTPIEERKEIERQLHDGEISIVSNVACLTTGIDWDVRCIILARPTKSEMLFVQMIGRGLRTADGKDDCIILDHSDTHLNLGFVTDIHYDELDDGKPKEKSERKEKEAPLPKDCPSCSYLKPPKVHQCPACGFKPEKASNVEHVDGELVELKAKKKANREATPEEKKRFYGELMQYGLDHGYKAGWASNKYRERFGVWPNAHKDATAVPVSSETLGWIKHTQIKFSKRSAA